MKGKKMFSNINELLTFLCDQCNNGGRNVPQNTALCIRLKPKAITTPLFPMKPNISIHIQQYLKVTFFISQQEFED